MTAGEWGRKRKGLKGVWAEVRCVFIRLPGSQSDKDARLDRYKRYIGTWVLGYLQRFEGVCGVDQWRPKGL